MKKNFGKHPLCGIPCKSCDYEELCVEGNLNAEQTVPEKDTGKQP